MSSPSKLPGPSDNAFDLDSFRKVLDGPTPEGKEKEPLPQHPKHVLDFLAKKAEAIFRSTQAEIDEWSKLSKEERKKSETKLWEAADVIGRSERNSRMDIDMLKKVVKSQSEQITNMKGQYLKQLEEQDDVINELIKTIDALESQQEKLQEKLKMLARTPSHKPKPTPNLAYQGVCYFCASPKHKAFYCGEFGDATERRQELTREGRCWLCFESHQGEECNKPQIKPCTCKETIRHKPEVCLIKATKEAIQAKREKHKELMKRVEEEKKKKQEEEEEEQMLLD